jgi:DNA-binding protein HU-beta
MAAYSRWDRGWVPAKRWIAAKCAKTGSCVAPGPVSAGENARGGGAAEAWLSPDRVSVEASYDLFKEEQMTKSEFVDQVADRSGLTKKDAGDAVDAMLETIESALKRGSDVVFSGFGKFSVSDRSAREGRNPATGEKIQIAASRVPKFSAGAALKKAVK